LRHDELQILITYLRELWCRLVRLKTDPLQARDLVFWYYLRIFRILYL